MWIDCANPSQNAKLLLACIYVLLVGLRIPNCFNTCQPTTIGNYTTKYCMFFRLEEIRANFLKAGRINALSGFSSTSRERQRSVSLGTRTRTRSGSAYRTDYETDDGTGPGKSRSCSIVSQPLYATLNKRSSSKSPPRNTETRLAERKRRQQQQIYTKVSDLPPPRGRSVERRSSTRRLPTVNGDGGVFVGLPIPSKFKKSTESRKSGTGEGPALPKPKPSPRSNSEKQQMSEVTSRTESLELLEMERAARQEKLFQLPRAPGSKSKYGLSYLIDRVFKNHTVFQIIIYSFLNSLFTFQPTFSKTWKVHWMLSKLSLITRMRCVMVPMDSADEKIYINLS